MGSRCSPSTTRASAASPPSSTPRWCADTPYSRPMAMPTDVSIRQGVPADAEQLAHLHVDVWDDAYTGLMPQGILDDRREKVAERVERWQEILGGDHTTWVAEDSEGLIGFASSGPARDNDMEETLELWALYVRASYWGS